MLWEGTELSQSEAFDIKLFRHQFLETLLCQAATTGASACSVAVKNIAKSKLVYQRATINSSLSLEKRQQDDRKYWVSC